MYLNYILPIFMYLELIFLFIGNNNIYLKQQYSKDKFIVFL